MAKCFISYKRKSPDQERAKELAEFLKRRKHEVFIDVETIKPGDKWAKETEEWLQSANFFIVLLSEKSVQSKMVLQEVRIANRLEQEQNTKLQKIIPVYVDFQDTLGYDWGAYLDEWQRIDWEKGEGIETIGEKIDAAIKGIGEVMPETENDSPAPVIGQDSTLETEAQQNHPMPVPANDIHKYRSEHGPVPLGSPLYIHRKADTLVDQFHSSARLILVKGTRGMGKSSFLVRLRDSAKKNHQIFLMDFTEIDSEQFASLDLLMFYLASEMHIAFETSVTPEEFWSKDISPILKIRGFIETAILAKSSSPILFLFDEPDRVINYHYKSDFFKAIRAWHNRDASDGYWKRLKMVITHSTDPTRWIDADGQFFLNFNVGEPKELEDFGFDHLSDLNLKYGTRLQDNDLHAMLKLVGGHPDLLHQAIYSLWERERPISALENEALDGRGPFTGHLRYYSWLLQIDEQMRNALHQILHHGACKDDESFQKLHASGLVRGDGREKVAIRCELYKKYFENRLWQS